MISSAIGRMFAGTACGAYVVSQNFPDLPFLRKLSAGTALFAGVVYINDQLEKQLPNLSEYVRVAEAGVITTSALFLAIDLYQGNVPVEKIVVTALKTLSLGQVIPGAVWCTEAGLRELQKRLAVASGAS